MVDKKSEIIPSQIDFGPAPQNETLKQKQERIGRAMAPYYQKYYATMEEKYQQAPKKKP